MRTSTSRDSNPPLLPPLQRRDVLGTERRDLTPTEHTGDYEGDRVRDSSSKSSVLTTWRWFVAARDSILTDKHPRPELTKGGRRKTLVPRGL